MDTVDTTHLPADNDVDVSFENLFHYPADREEALKFCKAIIDHINQN
jgi:hypothetical protein